MSLLKETYEYQQQTRINNLVVYTFDIDQDDLTYTVQFEKKRWGNKILYFISFGSDMDIILPDILNPLGVIRTVFEIFDEFHEEFDPDGYAFTPKNEKLDQIYQHKIEQLDEEFEYHSVGSIHVYLRL